MFNWFFEKKARTVADDKREAAKKVADARLKKEVDEITSQIMKQVNIATERGEFEFEYKPLSLPEWTFSDAYLKAFLNLRANGFKVKVKEDVHLFGYTMSGQYAVISWK